MKVVGHDRGCQSLDLMVETLLVGGYLFPLLHHRLAQRGEIDTGIGDVHVELAEEVVAVGDHDGDQIDATLVVVVAIAMRTMRGVHGRIAIGCVFVLRLDVRRKDKQ